MIIQEIPVIFIIKKMIKPFIILLFFSFPVKAQSWQVGANSTNIPINLFWHGDSLYCSNVLGVDSNLINYKWKGAGMIPASSLAGSIPYSLLTGTPAIPTNTNQLTNGANFLAATGSAASLTNFPTFNQNTTGSAGTLTTPRAINGVNFDGSAPITIASAAGTLTGTTLASNVVSSLLTSFGSSIALGTPASGTLTNCTFPTLNQNTTGTAANITASSNTTLTSLANLTTIGTLVAGSVPYTLLSGTVTTWNQNTTGTAANITGSSNTTLTSLVNLVTVGTIGTGTWQGTAVVGTYGGTGVNNGAKTITLGGNLTTSGAFNTTLTTTATTSVTLPTAGNLFAGNASSALTNSTTITCTPSLIALNFTLALSTNSTTTINMGTIPAACVGLDLDISITTTTTSDVITWGTSFKSQGTLSTGTTSGKIFHMKFHIVTTSEVDEISRTTAM